MLDRLLESKSRRTRSPLGVVASVGAHLAIIVVAIHATAQSRPRPAAPLKSVIISFVPKPAPSQAARSDPERRKAADMPVRPYLPIKIDLKLSELPPIDFAPLSTSLSDFPKGIESNSTSSAQASKSPGSGIFNADQVEKQVALLAGAPVPNYPEALRAAGIEGKVVAQFVVDERGRVEADSVRFLQSDNALFEASVRTVLHRMRFAPAEIAGKTVSQLVQMPFVFTITRR